MDPCSALTTDLLQLMRVNLNEERGKFNTVVGARLRMLLDNEFVRSIYGSSASRVIVSSHHHSNHLSESPSISAMREEAAAQLAAKRAKIDMEADTEAQPQQLRKLENQRHLEVIRARLHVFTEEEGRDGTDSLLFGKVNDTSPSAHHILDHKQKRDIISPVVRSLSPTPEPIILSGNPK